MEQINYDKLQYDTTKNKNFTIIDQTGPGQASFDIDVKDFK